MAACRYAPVWSCLTVTITTRPAGRDGWAGVAPVYTVARIASRCDRQTLGEHDGSPTTVRQPCRARPHNDQDGAQL